MKLAAVAAVLLFCVGPAAAPADAQLRCSGRSSAVNVQVGTAPVNIRVNQRRGFLRGRSRARVNVNVGSSFVPSVSSFQFVQPASFVSLPQPILNLNAGYGYGYGGSDGSYLAQRIRQEAAETADLKDAIGELLGRMNQPVTAP